MNRKLTGVLIGLAGAIGLGFLLSRSAKGGEGGGTTVHGVVSDAGTGEPIAGAEVRITDFGVPPSGHYSIDKRTYSDSEGKYSFTVNLASIYTPPTWVGEGRGVTISAIAFHYGPMYYNVIIEPGENILDIHLSY
jgi:hypothetical protein